MLSKDVSELRAKVRQWHSELNSPNVRRTLPAGMITTGFLAFEEVLTQTIIALTGVLDDAGKARCKLLLGGKTISGCSLGDKRSLLAGLKPDFERALTARGLQVSDAFLGKDDMDTLQTLVQHRNRALHGKMGIHIKPEIADIIVSNIGLFCDSGIVRAATQLGS